MPAGEANAQHYFVATQDRALRAALGRVPGGASIFMNVNGVHLEQPSEQQRRSTEQVHGARFASCLHVAVLVVTMCRGGPVCGSVMARYAGLSWPGMRVCHVDGAWHHYRAEGCIRCRA